jgi:hypothetical protein
MANIKPLQNQPGQAAKPEAAKAARNQDYFVQGILFVIGLINVITALLQIFAPAWFFQNIGNFPPYNRHYVGDLGAFILPLGLGLIYAARHPRKNILLIWVVFGGSLFHLVNHIYDAIIDQASLLDWLLTPGSLLLVVLLLGLVLFRLTKRQ